MVKPASFNFAKNPSFDVTRNINLLFRTGLSADQIYLEVCGMKLLEPFGTVPLFNIFDSKHM